MTKLILEKIKDKLDKLSGEEACIDGYTMNISTQYKIVYEHFRLANIGFGVPHDFWNLGEAVFDFWFQTIQSKNTRGIYKDKDILREAINNEMKCEPTDENMKVRINIMELLGKKFRFIDLFCGIGGFHLAMTSLGGECVFASDIDEDCRKTYEANYGIKPVGDITKIDAIDIPAHDLLCAGFPCQSFSKAGKRLGFEDETKGTLFFDICRILEHHKPKYALLENVRNLASHDHGNTWKVIHDRLEKLGYNLLPEPVIFSPHYIGIPQHRERVYIMCIRKDLGRIKSFSFDKKKTRPCSIETILQNEDEIQNLQDYRISQDMENLIDLWNEFVQSIKAEKLPGFPIWTDRLCDIDPNEDLSQYPNWKQNFIHKNNELYLANRKFIDKWLIKARKNPLFFGAKAKLEWQAGQTDNPNIWNQIFQLRPSGIRVKVNSYFPALVAIVQTSIIGSRHRFLTPRECARLQSFPDSFKPDEKTIQAYKQFGNAVNVECVKLFAKHLLEGNTIKH